MDDPKPRNLTSGLAQNEPEQDRGAFYQRLNYEKLASDRIGEELNPNASIWKLYAEEAKEYDIEFTRERNENLNNMLLFATLFSAIVTTFIIESTNLLEQDSSDVSTQLLLMLVQSQRRIETGITNYTATPVEIPEFVPSPTARLINVLWFASLMISLGAAVVAILAKEWLTAFTTNRTRDAHKYALERQARHISLEIWNMLLIIDLLPTFLNFSLFVFCLGLIIRLWLLDFVVAGVTTVISAVVCGIYLFFVISGAVYETCPYKARLSAYVREIVQGLHKRFTASESSPQINRNNIKPDSQKTIKSEEMDLLNWLFSSSSDPFLGTYVTQALAGLRSLSLDLPTFLSKENSIQALCSTYTQNSKTLTSVFELGYQALTQLQMAPIQGRNELESCEGSNAARLAIAIAEIYPYALTWQLCLPEKAFQVRENTLSEAERNTPKIASSNGTTKPGTNDNTLAIKMPSACKITDDVFHALDLVWVETSPALGLSVYANLLTAELKMVRHALAFLSPQEETRGTNSSNVSTERAAPPNGQDRLLPRYSRLRAMTQSALIVTARLLKVLRGARLPGPSEEEPPISPGHTSIEMATSSDIRSRLLGLGQDGLRERYGLALTRAALIIKASLSHLTSKGSQELQSAITALLSQATELVEQEKPGSDGTYRFGTDDYWDLRDISITIASKSDTVQVVTCRREALAYELMEGLIRLCEGGSGDAPLLEGFRVAAFNLLVTFWPAHIQQRKLDRSVESSVLTWAVQQWETIPTQATRCDSQISAEIIVYQSTVLAHIAVSLGNGVLDEILPDEHQEWNNVFQLALKVLTSRSNVLSKRESKLMINAMNRENDSSHNSIYYRWLPTTSTLGAWILSLRENHLSPTPSGESSHQLTWCIYSIINMTAHLTYPDDYLVSVFAQATQPGNPITHMGPHVHQFMEFFYTTSQAPDRDETAPVIATLLTQVAEHIRTTNCHECLSYFTQERAFNILAGIGSAKPDRRAVITVVSTVVIGLVTARLRVNTEALPSLLKVLCYMCDYDFDHLYDIDAFLIGARFQLEQLPTIIGPSILFPIQKLIYRLNVWAGMWEDHHWSNYSQKITSLQNQVQHWIDPNNPGGILPPDADHWEPIMDATMIIIPSPDMPQSDSAPEDTLTEAGLSGWINYIPSPQGSIEDEFALESAPTASEEQSAD